MLCGTACSQLPAKPVSPDPIYLQDRPEPPAPTARTNGAIVYYIQLLREQLRLSNADKAALRAWADSKESKRE
ncbi:Rz1-like lysis system protein LysC [Escherichia coli]|uniref:Rz1-like lysis system protein LysC n=1 Tax=Escherichia coli TaxID=562 RepID=UPI003C6D3104